MQDMVASVTGVGVLTGLGSTLAELQERLDAGESALKPLGEVGWESRLGSRVPGPALRALLKRRKDAKL